MVTFGGYKLQHVLGLVVQEMRVIHDRIIPGATVGYRRDETEGGRIITVSGEIRDPDYVLRLEELRVRADDTARHLDLEDGSGEINAKLGTIEAAWDAERRIDRVAYQATFLETS